MASIFRSLLPRSSGSLSKGKARDKTQQRREFMALRASLPADALHSYTDGSSYASERAGSGYVICSPSGLLLHQHSSFLGPVSNNVAELDAMASSLRHLTVILQRSTRKPARSIALFSDSKYALNIANGTWKAKAHLPLVRQLRSALAFFRTLTTVSLLWVPAHADIYHNDLADLLAKRGAEGISSHDALDFPSMTHLRQSALNPLPADPPHKRQCIFVNHARSFRSNFRFNKLFIFQKKNTNISYIKNNRQ